MSVSGAMASVIKQTTRRSCSFCSLTFSCRSLLSKHTKKKNPEKSKENSLDKGLKICHSCSDALKFVQNHSVSLSNVLCI